MAKEESRSNRRKSNRERAKRRKELAREERLDEQITGKETFAVKWGKQVFLTGLFATALIFIVLLVRIPPAYGLWEKWLLKMSMRIVILNT